VVERGITDILKDTVSNIQDIIRSEILLGKIEIKEEVSKAKTAGVMFGAAVGLVFFGIGFCLLGVVYALTLVLPAWAAALIVGVASLLVGGILFAVGRARWGKVKMPEKTMFTVKEDIAWMRSKS
jgi:uncharacterized membrane protein YqjE